MLTQFGLCAVNKIFFSSAHELLSACIMAVFFFFFNVFCVSVYLYYISLVVRAASIDGCLCLSGSLPLLSCMLVLILCFEANKYDDRTSKIVEKL